MNPTLNKLLQCVLLPSKLGSLGNRTRVVAIFCIFYVVRAHETLILVSLGCIHWPFKAISLLCGVEKYLMRNPHEFNGVTYKERQCVPIIFFI